ncbi:MAG: VOC family protein [Anaerolineae bacterium]|nr:VOC family protein [Anaerolineae bacterium]
MTLPQDTHIGSAHLRTADLRRSLAFYSDLIGFGLLSREDGAAVLSADGQTPHLRLSEHPGWLPKPHRSVGLYHVAIRLPNRVALAGLFRRMVEARVPFGGFSDHAVSEALYLDDPDGNGLELYRDRPRDQWPRLGDRIQMTTEALDVHQLLAEGESAWTGLHPQTDIGHVHLHVSSLEKARAFYGDILGLDMMADWSGHGAIFMAAGGYHHHLGLNIWAGSQPQPPQTLGLEAFSLVIPDRAAWTRLGDSLRAAQRPLSQPDERSLITCDQDGNSVELVTA